LIQFIIKIIITITIIIRPHRLHAVHEMRLIATHGARSIIRWRNRPHGLCVGHMGELCKNGWTDRGAVLGADSCGPKEPCIRWGSRWDESIRPARGDKTAMRPLVKLLWTLVIVVVAITVIITTDIDSVLCCAV